MSITLGFHCAPARWLQDEAQVPDGSDADLSTFTMLDREPLNAHIVGDIAHRATGNRTIRVAYFNAAACIGTIPPTPIRTIDVLHQARRFSIQSERSALNFFIDEDREHDGR
ncbi:hypothetical protein [Novosphingobium sp. Leaf2]|uniref:hypothetical protein n=1 Tax=Novosphingobium sp. Leaf2 TaxID=1735670 RepID=UPI000712FA92|nr:hypothetical protein [Novosphingobium sp. Leaf2]KQM18859.1 hypothetical protein ASE49_06940 [Novosphingobium sp. Leaf2]